ncbi:MAG: MarR family transcriptional regulator [Pseudonocardia sp.]|nr:MarR family transcriptional regulator [Pseudonocardia sp.]
MIGAQINSTIASVQSSSAGELTDSGLLALDRQVCFALAVAARTVIALYRPLLEPMGLTHPQYLVLLALWEHAPRSGRELATVLQLDPGTLTPLLKRLESAGYLVRRRDPDDERSLAVTLTPAGRALRAQALRIPPAIIDRLGMPLAQLEELRESLNHVIAAATAEPVSAGAAPDLFTQDVKDADGADGAGSAGSSRTIDS